MFRGDQPELKRLMVDALTSARGLGSARTGSEHLLLALTSGTTPVAAVLAGHGATTTALRAALSTAGPSGAGAAADAELLAAVGIHVDGLDRTTSLDLPPRREPLLPLGAATSRERCARMDPPLGLDAQAAYAASLRLALARREREHRVEHLAITLVALDPGIAWLLAAAGVRQRPLLGALAATFPPPHRNPLLQAERRIARRHRHRDLLRRYHDTTGRTALGVPAALITG